MTTIQNAVSATAGKYLTFTLASEHYGIEITRVQEIVGMMPVTRVPRLPAVIAGIVNLRGRVIPVVDLRLAFGLPASETTERTCIIVVTAERLDGGANVVGAIVDDVSEVVAFRDDAIEPTPDFSSEVDISFVKGVGRADDRVVLLLDVDKALSDTQMGAVELAMRAAEGEQTAYTQGDE